MYYNLNLFSEFVVTVHYIDGTYRNKTYKSYPIILFLLKLNLKMFRDL